MSDAAWSSYRSYADRVLVRIKLVGSAADDAESIEEWFIESSGAAWEPDWLVRNVEAIPMNAGAGDQDVPAEYYIEVRERRMNWGAAGAVFDILLGLASWAATSVAWDATKSLAGQMYQRLSSANRNELVSRPLTDAEAAERATWLIASNYDEAAAALSIQSVELAGSTATVVLTSPTGWSYECDLEHHDDLVIVTRVRRSRLQ